jgi:hypothetical protein
MLGLCKMLCVCVCVCVYEAISSKIVCWSKSKRDTIMEANKDIHTTRVRGHGSSVQIQSAFLFIKLVLIR